MRNGAFINAGTGQSLPSAAGAIEGTIQVGKGMCLSSAQGSFPPLAAAALRCPSTLQKRRSKSGCYIQS